MKILIIKQHFTSLDQPGIARLSIFSSLWGRQGHLTSILAGRVIYITGRKAKARPSTALRREPSRGGVAIIRVFDSALGYRTYLGRLISYFSFLPPALIAGLTLPRPDVIIFSSPPTVIGVVAFILGSLRGVAVVFEVRDLWPDVAIDLGFVKNRLVQRLGYAVERSMYRRAHRIVAISPGMGDFLAREKGVPRNKIGVIPNPVDLGLTRSREGVDVRRQMNWKDKFVVLYSGSHSAVYDFDTLLDLAAGLRSQENILFVLLGDGRQKPQVARRVEQEQMTNVSLLPPVSKAEVGAIIGAADLCIATLKPINTLRYGYATKIFDYMAMKKPVILAMDGEAAQLVNEEANCGIAVGPGQTQALREAILDLYHDPEKRRSLGENGYSFVQRHRAADELAQRYLELLKAASHARRIERRRYG